MFRPRKLKVRGGTRSEEKRLCDTCSSGHIIRGSAESQEAVLCTYFDGAIPFKVVECNKYADKSTPSLYDLRRSAWIVQTDKSGQSIGFVSPSRWRKDHKGEPILPEDEDDFDE